LWFDSFSQHAKELYSTVSSIKIQVSRLFTIKNADNKGIEPSIFQAPALSLHSCKLHVPCFRFLPKNFELWTLYCFSVYQSFFERFACLSCGNHFSTFSSLFLLMTHYSRLMSLFRGE